MAIAQLDRTMQPMREDEIARMLELVRRGYSTEEIIQLFSDPRTVDPLIRKGYQQDTQMRTEQENWQRYIDEAAPSPGMPATMDELPRRFNNPQFKPTRTLNDTLAPRAKPNEAELQGNEGVPELVGGASADQIRETFTVPNGVRLTVSARTGLRGLDTRAKQAIQAMVNAAPAAGVVHIDVTAGREGGHASHMLGPTGTEIDLKGFMADGSLWTPGIRAQVAEAATTVGADRIGLYSSPGKPVGNGSLHVGFSGPAGNASVWGLGQRTDGPASRRFADPAERQFLANYVARFPQSVPAGEPDTVKFAGQPGASVQAYAAVDQGAPENPPLPRIKSEVSTKFAAMQRPEVAPATAFAEPEASAPISGGAQAAESVSRFAAAEPAEAAPAAVAAAAQARGLDLEPAASTPEGLTVMVRKGDTIGKFARQYPGDKSDPSWLQNRVNEIAAASGVRDPDRIFPGMVLTIPGVSGPPTPRMRPGTEVAAAEPEAVPPVQGPARENPPTTVAPPVATPPPAQSQNVVQREVPASAPSVPPTVDSRGLEWTTGTMARAPGPALPTTPSATSPQDFATRFEQTDTGGLYPFPDSIVRTPQLDLGGTVAANVPQTGDLDLVPQVPPTPTKDQSRIAPDMPSQRQPAARVAPPKESGEIATSPVDFQPIAPEAFSRRNPPGVANVQRIISPTGGAGIVSYDQNGYRITSTAPGVAMRTVTGTVTNTAPPSQERWNPSLGRWEPLRASGGKPISSLTPVQQNTNPNGMNWSTTYG